MREHNVNNLENTIEVVQGRNGGIETRDSILALYRNRILFASRICHFHLATRMALILIEYEGGPLSRIRVIGYPMQHIRVIGVLMG